MNQHIMQNCPEKNIKDVQFITWVGLSINILLSGFKFAAGVLGKSQALIADAVHSFSDMSTDVTLLFGVRHWSAPPDDQHPYGHQRIETLITAFIGIVLGLVAVGIVYNALLTIRQHHIEQPGKVALIAALISIVFKEALYHWTIFVGKKIDSSAVLANAWHHRSDALSSIPVAIAVVVSILRPEWSFIDHAAALVVAVFIFKVAVDISKPALLELTDGGVSKKTISRIKDIASASQGIKSIHAVRARKLGPGIHVDLHIIVDKDITVYEGHEIARQLKHTIREVNPRIVDVLVHVEPD